MAENGGAHNSARRKRKAGFARLPVIRGAICIGDVRIRRMASSDGGRIRDVQRLQIPGARFGWRRFPQLLRCAGGHTHIALRPQSVGVESTRFTARFSYEIRVPRWSRTDRRCGTPSRMCEAQAKTRNPHRIQPIAGGRAGTLSTGRADKRKFNAAGACLPKAKTPKELHAPGSADRRANGDLLLDSGPVNDRIFLPGAQIYARSHSAAEA